MIYHQENHVISYELAYFQQKLKERRKNKHLKDFLRAICFFLQEVYKINF